MSGVFSWWHMKRTRQALIRTTFGGSLHVLSGDFECLYFSFHCSQNYWLESWKLYCHVKCSLNIHMVGHCIVSHLHSVVYWSILIDLPNTALSFNVWKITGTFRHYRVTEKSNLSVHYIAVSTTHMLTSFYSTEYEKLFLCPPVLLNVAALPWEKLIIVFSLLDVFCGSL